MASLDEEWYRMMKKKKKKKMGIDYTVGRELEVHVRLGQ